MFAAFHNMNLLYVCMTKIFPPIFLNSSIYCVLERMGPRSGCSITLQSTVSCAHSLFSFSWIQLNIRLKLCSWIDHRSNHSVLGSINQHQLWDWLNTLLGAFLARNMHKTPIFFRLFFLEQHFSLSKINKIIPPPQQNSRLKTCPTTRLSFNNSFLSFSL